MLAALKRITSGGSREGSLNGGEWLNEESGVSDIAGVG
jgi:hypothetical protein